MKVLLIGARGFVGNSIREQLAKIESLELFTTSRKPKENNEFFFDFLKEESWKTIMDASFDVIINAAAYGVVKYETDLQVMYNTNYLALQEFLSHLGKKTRFLQIGSAFEYDIVNEHEISEKSNALPVTHYGISKLMATQYISKKFEKEQAIVLRPFAMYGPNEDKSKIIPYLINAQITGTAIDLSSGLQQRDYMYVEDFANYVCNLISKNWKHLPAQIINVGSNTPVSLRDIAKEIKYAFAEDFREGIWNWNILPQRKGESHLFINASDLAKKSGLKTTPLKEGIKKTVEKIRDQHESA